MHLMLVFTKNCTRRAVFGSILCNALRSICRVFYAIICIIEIKCCIFAAIKQPTTVNRVEGYCRKSAGICP